MRSEAVNEKEGYRGAEPLTQKNVSPNLERTRGNEREIKTERERIREKKIETE